MIKTIQIKDLKCVLVTADRTDKVTYMIYPEIAGFTDELLTSFSQKYDTAIVMVYVPAQQWNNYLTPWAEPGEAKGFPPFAGEAPMFLQILTDEIVPQAENEMGIDKNAVRNLIGVSLSGLFTLWQWLQCDTFNSIACLSGSFWYAGFMDWFNNLSLRPKQGKAFFLLGRQEPHAQIVAYRPVGANTQAVVSRLEKAGYDVSFEWVQGNHFADPVGRAEMAFIHIS